MIRTDDELVCTRTGQTEPFHQLMSLTGGDHRSVRSVSAGDIGAVAKLEDTATGDTLAPVGLPVTIPPPELPAAVHGVAVSAKTPAHEDRLAMALRRIVTEDPTLSVSHDGVTHQTVLSGAGETHLSVAISRIERMGVEVESESPRVAYREALAGSVEVEGKYKKQTGGHGQFGIASVRFEPLPRALVSSSPARSPAAPSPRTSSRRSVPASRRAWRAAGCTASPWSTSAPPCAPMGGTTRSTRRR